MVLARTLREYNINARNRELYTICSHISPLLWCACENRFEKITSGSYITRMARERNANVSFGYGVRLMCEWKRWQSFGRCCFSNRADAKPIDTKQIETQYKQFAASIFVHNQRASYRFYCCTHILKKRVTNHPYLINSIRSLLMVRSENSVQHLYIFFFEIFVLIFQIWYFP